LFTIFINDLDEDIKRDILKFADDVKLIGRVGSKEDVDRLRMDFTSLDGWAERWQMKLNVEKCKVMNIVFKNKEEHYVLNGAPLGVIKEEKDLGAIVCQKLKVGKPCFKTASKGNQVLGMIKRTFTSRSKEIIIPLYKSLVRPHLDYCVQAWRPHLIKDVQVLEMVQRRATRFIDECRGMSYEDRLSIVGLTVTTLETRRLRADMIEVYTILKGFEGADVLVRTVCVERVECSLRTVLGKLD